MESELSSRIEISREERALLASPPLSLNMPRNSAVAPRAQASRRTAISLRFISVSAAAYADRRLRCGVWGGLRQTVRAYDEARATTTHTHTSKILICGFRRRNRRRRRAFGKQTTVYSRRVVSSCAPQSFPPRPPVGDDGGSFRNRLSLRNDEKKKYEKKKFQVFPRYRNTPAFGAR